MWNLLGAAAGGTGAASGGGGAGGYGATTSDTTAVNARSQNEIGRITFGANDGGRTGLYIAGGIVVAALIAVFALRR